MYGLTVSKEVFAASQFPKRRKRSKQQPADATTAAKKAK